MRAFLRSPKSIPVLIAFLTLVGYGLLLPYTGFHWDDWGFAWIAEFLGPSEFIPAFRGFRPFLGPIFLATTSLIPPVPLYWQVFALVIRFLIGLTAWWALKTIWPERPRTALAVACFVLVFPGYSQHWVALTHINQELIPFIFYLLSFGLTALAIHHSSFFIPLTFLALLTQFLGLFPTEYFFGLEPLRFLFIWSMLDEREMWPRLRRALLIWLPYLLLWLADAAWLVSLYRSEAYVSYGITTPADLTPLNILKTLADAVLKAGLYAWVQVLPQSVSTLSAPTSLLTLGLSVINFTLFTFYVFRLNFLNPQSPIPNPQSPSSSKSFPPSYYFPFFLLLSGLVGILLGRLPSLAAGLPLTLGTTFDRFMISMTLGSSLFLAGLIELLFQRSERARLTAIGLIVALGVGGQFFNANLFRRDWARQQEVHRQLAWRIPALQPGTLILTDSIPGLPFETDLSFTAPVNWMYAPDYAGGDLPYALLYTEARLGGGALPALRPDQPVTVPFRTISFHGSTNSALVILVPENGCLRVLDPALGDVVTYEKESRFLLDAIPFSDPSLILTEAHLPMPAVPPFVPEADPTWCYYYEKAELARQVGDWEQIVRLARTAGEAGLGPEDVFEWLPFIEAYARTGSADRAADLSRQAFRDAARVRKGLCQVWERVQAGAAEGNVTRQMLSEIGCTP